MFLPQFSECVFQKQNLGFAATRESSEIRATGQSTIGRQCIVVRSLSLQVETLGE